MRKIFSSFFLVLFAMQSISRPLESAELNWMFQRPLSDSSSGMSFRGRDIVDINRTTEGNDPQKDMSRGLMLTNPTISNLFYQVHVLGEVKNPGTYRITASDRLSEVITKAGGIRESGSERHIKVKNTGRVRLVADLIKFKLFASLDDNPYLLDNDVVYVPLKERTIQIVGAVKRPDVYELVSETNLYDVLALAGGFTVGAATNNSISIVRFKADGKNVLQAASDDQGLKSFEVLNGDVIFVPHLITVKNSFDYDIPKLPGDNIFYPSFEDRVFILGGVSIPGPYPFNPYYKLSQYLSLSGGTTKMFTGRIWLLDSEGHKKRLRKKDRDRVTINPGDTIIVGERRITPEGWVSLFMSVAGFGLSATATILTLTQ